MSVQLHIRCLEGEGKTQEQTTYTLKPGREVTIGRSSDNDVVLSDARVSSSHAALRVQSGPGESTIRLYDLGSSNGTYVEGERIPSHVPRVIDTKTRVLIGPFLIQISSSNVVASEPEQNQKSDSAQPIGRQLTRSPEKGIATPAIANRSKVRSVSLGQLVEDAENSAIFIGPNRQVWVERQGKLALTTLSFSSAQKLIGVLEEFLGRFGCRLESLEHAFSVRLPGALEISGVMSSDPDQGPYVVIRKPQEKIFTLDDLVQRSFMSEAEREFISLSVSKRANLVVCGESDSGRSLLLSAMLACLDDRERTVLIEQSRELPLEGLDIMAISVQSQDGSNQKADSMQSLIRISRSLSPKRLVVCDPDESSIAEYVRTLEMGFRGSICLSGASSPEDLLSLWSCALDPAMPQKARVRSARSLDAVICVKRFPCGTRCISSISEMLVNENAEVEINPIFHFHEIGYDAEGSVEGLHQATGYVPFFFRKIRDQLEA